MRAWQREPEPEGDEAAEGRRGEAAAQARRGEEARRKQAGHPAALLVSAAACNAFCYSPLAVVLV